MAKQKHVLNVKTRVAGGSSAARRMRGEGHVPAVVYSKGGAAKTISFESSEWDMLSKYELNLVSLMEEGKETLALIKEVQKDFIRGKVSHIDFLEVNRNEKIKATVSVHPGPVAPAGLSQGGMLDQNLYEIEVECLPDLLPESISVDVSKLELGQALHVRDLVLAEGIRATSPAELAVFHVVDPNMKETEVAATAEEGAPAEPEVVGAKEKAEKAAAEEAEKAEKEKKK